MNLSAGREDSLDVVLKVQTILGPRPEQGKLNIILLDGEKRGFKSEELTNRLRERAGAIPGVSNLSFGSGHCRSVNRCPSRYGAMTLRN